MRVYYITVLLGLLSACGGGGSGGEPPSNPVNLNPAFTSGESATSTENQLVPYTATAIDPNSGDQLSFAITGGADAAEFTIGTTSGALSFVAGSDFESPRDADGDNIYEFELQAVDGRGGAASLSVSLSILDESLLDLEITFPTPNAELGGEATEITVTGTIVDTEDGEVLDSDIQFIDVNSVAAIQSLSNPGRWSAVVPVNGRHETIVATTRSVSETEDSDSLQVTNQHDLLEPHPIVVDEVNNRAFVVSAFPATLIEVDLNTGTRSVVSGGSVGTGTDVLQARGMAFDGTDGTVYVSRGSSIVAIDVATGDRRELSGVSTGAGPAFGSLEGMDIDAAGRRLVIGDSQLRAVLSVDLNTGNRSVISDIVTGTGPSLRDPAAIALDLSNNRVMVMDDSTLFSIDLATGNRVILSTNSMNAGPDFTNPGGILLDTLTNRVLVSARDQSAIIAIDITSGARLFVSNDSVGTGTTFEIPAGLAWGTSIGNILVTDSERYGVFELTTATGDRNMLSDNSVGFGVRDIIYNNFDLNESQNLAYVAHAPIDSNSLVRVDFTTGEKKIVADNATGSGPDMLLPQAVALNATGDQLIWLGSFAGIYSILWIDVQSGDRTLIADNTTGSGPDLVWMLGVEIDEPNNRALILDHALGGIAALDLTTGDRTIISNSATGSGPEFVTVTQIALGPLGQTAYVTDEGLQALVRVDLATGDRTVLSDAVTGSGPALSGPRGLDVDSDNNRAFITSTSGIRALFAVDLATGNRTVISGANLGRGPELNPMGKLRFDGSRNRAFMSATVIAHLKVIEIESGDRAIASR